MKSNYRRIGDYIREIKIRNKDLNITDLRGINIDKYFMPSVANTIGTDMSKYKIVKKGQFACNRMHVGRDKRLPIALHMEDESIIVSPAYTVFEIIDEEVLNTEYLMMWFSRSEFDRESWFYTDSDVRGGLSLDDFLDINIPIIKIEEQKEIVRKYNSIIYRIDLKKSMINKLEETINTIYKQWFIAFDFPNQEGQLYKSDGGKLYFNNKLNKEIPEGWDVETLGQFMVESKGGDWGKSELTGRYNSRAFCIRGTDIPQLRIGSIGNMPVRYILEKNLENKQLLNNQIVIEISGGSPIQSTGRAVLITESLLENIKDPIICSNFCQAITVENLIYVNFIFSHINYLYKSRVFFNYENSTIALKNLDLSGLLAQELIVKPPNYLLDKYNLLYKKINKLINSYGKEVELLEINKKNILSELMVNKNRIEN